MSNPILELYRNKRTGANVWAAPYKPYGNFVGYEMYCAKTNVGGPVHKEFFESTYEKVQAK